MKTQKRKRILTKFTAVLLLSALLMQPFANLVFADTGDTWTKGVSSPVISYRGEPLTNGKEIPEDAYLVAEYEFSVDFRELAGSANILSLPDPLVAVIDGALVIEGDADGARYEIGELTEHDGTLAVRFYDDPVEVNEDQIILMKSQAPVYLQAGNDGGGGDGTVLPGEGDDGIVLPSEGEGSEGVVLPVEDNDATGPSVDESLTVTGSFEISCKIHLENMPQADGGQPRQVTVMSGGREVTVTLTEAAGVAAPTLLDSSGHQAFGSPWATIEKITLSRQTSADNWEALVTSDDQNPPVLTINTTDTLRLTYDFFLDEDQVEGIRTIIQAGNNVDFLLDVVIPENLECIWQGGSVYTSRLNIEVTEGSTTNTMQFGTLYLIPAGDSLGNPPGVYLKFEGDFWDTDVEKIEQAHLFVICKLDESIQRSVTSCTVELGSLAVEVHIGDHQPTAHTLTKARAYNEHTRIFTWTVTFTPGDAAVALPITFTDTYSAKHGAAPARVQDYVADSLTVKAGDTALTQNTHYTLEFRGDEDNIIVCTVTDLPEATVGKPIVLTYKTQLTGAAFSDGNELKTTVVRNDVTVTDSGGAPLAPPAYATHDVTVAIKTLIKKEAVDSRGNTVTTVDGKTIRWKVTVYTRGFVEDNLVLHDLIPAGLSAPYDVMIGETGISAGMTLVGPDANGNSEYTLAISKNTLSPWYNDTYVITYSTDIDEAYLTEVAGAGETHEGYLILNPGFTNTTWLSFDRVGTGPGFKTPEVTLTPAVGNHIITKAAGTPNMKDHTIEWTVTINPLKLNVTGGTVSDVLKDVSKGMDTGLAYVGGTFVPLGGADLTLADPSDNDPTKTYDSLTVTVGNIGRNTVQFRFTTVMTDSAWYACNTNIDPAVDSHATSNLIHTTTNTAEFDGWVKLDDPDGSVQVKDKASATAKVSSTVLEKKNGGYNYDDHTVTWEITVNKNKMPMTNVTLIDAIPQYQEFVEVVSITPQSVSDFVAGDPGRISTAPGTQDGVSEIVTINLGSIDDAVVVTLKTKVLVDEHPGFWDSKVITVGNTVTLTREDYSDITVDAGQSVQNPVLGKAGTYNSTNRTIGYSVSINPNGLDLRMETLENIKLTDKLPSGLQLDVDSVKLYEARAALGAGGVLGISKTGSGAVDFTWSYNVADNSFSINLPEARCYVLEYSCYILSSSAATYRNSIVFEGDYFDEDISSSVDPVMISGGWAMTISPGTVGLTILKRDSKEVGGTHAPLEGVIFQLRTAISGTDTLVDERVTDADGKLTFSHLKPGREYRLVEKAGILGYTAGTATVSPDGGTTFVELAAYRFTPTTAQADQTVEIIIENDRDTAGFSLLKVNQRSSRVTGAQFKLTDTEDSGRTLTATSNKGIVAFTEVPFGTYTLEETKQASGYEQNKETYAVTIDKNFGVEIRQNSDDSLLPVTDVSEGTLYTIVNTELSTDGGYDKDKSTGTTKPSGAEDSGNPVSPGNSGSADPETPDSSNPDAEQSSPPMPTPMRPGSTLVPIEDGRYLEIGDDGVPIGTWIYNDEEEEWIFVSIEDGPLPLTGTADLFPVMSMLSLFGLVPVSAFALLIFKKKKMLNKSSLS